MKAAVVAAALGAAAVSAIRPPPYDEVVRRLPASGSRSLTKSSVSVPAQGYTQLFPGTPVGGSATQMIGQAPWSVYNYYIYTANNDGNGFKVRKIRCLLRAHRSPVGPGRVYSAVSSTAWMRALVACS